MGKQLQGLRRIIGIALLGLALAQAPLCLATLLFFSNDKSRVPAAVFCFLTNIALLGLVWRKVYLRLAALIQDGQDADAAAASRLETERAAQTQSAHELTRSFDKSFAALRDDMFGRLSSVKASTDTLNQTTDTLSRATLRITSETTAVAVAVEDAQRQIATVVTSGQEFLTTISAIGAHAARSTTLGVEAIDVTRATANNIEELASSFDKIGSMASFISGIANQTNLLALNATIEAARAGEQGKGFAVVAGEVKSLATETTKAVTLIADLVATIRGAMSRVNAAMQTTAVSIEGLNQATAEIAAAVDERVEAANHMARSVEKSAFNVGFVTKAIGNIEIAIDEAAAGMGLLRGAARDITAKTAAMVDQLEQPATDQGVYSQAECAKVHSRALPFRESEHRAARASS